MVNSKVHDPKGIEGISAVFWVSKPANKHAYRAMKRWSNQVRIHSKLLAKSSKSIKKASLLQVEDSSFLNKPRNKRKGNKATKDYKYAQQTDPETSQISHALFSHFCTKSRQHIKEIKTPVLRHRTFTQIHEQERIRMKKNPQQARQQISTFKWKSQWCVHRKGTRKEYL